MGPNAQASEDMVISTDCNAWQVESERADTICI